MLIYAIVFAIGLAGLTQMSWWAAAVGACILSLKLIYDDWRPVHAGALTLETTHIASNLIVSLVSSPLAFLGGRLTAVLWGL
jgi:hypothetical protein